MTFSRCLGTTHVQHADEVVVDACRRNGVRKDVRRGSVDAICYRSRLSGGEFFAIFERALTKLTVIRTQDLLHHPDLPAVLREHGVTLER